MDEIQTQEIPAQENDVAAEVPQQDQESYGQERMLQKKKPNLFWMMGTLIFLVASLLELYALLTASPIITPAQYMSNMTLINALSQNTIALNAQYHRLLTNRGHYELGCIVVAAVMGIMTAKNLWLRFRD